jgi:hypothetical protein
LYCFLISLYGKTWDVEVVEQANLTVVKVMAVAAQVDVTG